MEPNYLLRMVYGGDPLESLDERGPIELTKAIPFDTGEASISTPITVFLGKAAKGLLVKSGVADERWDAELMKTTADPAALPASSHARLEKTYAVINRIFNGHEAEAAEAREIAKWLLIETRAEVGAALTAAA
jgi:hypothetical protein